MVALNSNGDPVKFNAFMNMTRSEFFAVIYGKIAADSK